MKYGKEATFEHASQIVSALETVRKAVADREHKWHIEKLIVYANGLFERAPFQPGDRVRLSVTPTITTDVRWGWLGAKHFLVAGALGTVHEVDFRDGHFCAGVAWDDESWIRHSTNERVPVDPQKRSLYTLWDTQIERVNDTTEANENQLPAEEETG